MVQTENTVRHTKYGRIRGMVAGEGGRSSKLVMLYMKDKNGYTYERVSYPSQIVRYIICGVPVHYTVHKSVQ